MPGQEIPPPGATPRITLPLGAAPCLPLSYEAKQEEDAPGNKHISSDVSKCVVQGSLDT